MTEPSIDGWQLREERRGNEVVRFVERPIPGRRGVVERKYDPGTAEDRYGVVVAGVNLKERGVRAAVPRPVVVFSPGALQTISRLATWETGRDKLETGGSLIGVVAADGTVRVERATVSTKHRARTSVSVRLNGAGALDGSCLCGDWHSHPSGSSKPSPQDLAAWAKEAARSRPDGLPHWVSVIAYAPKQHTEPSLHAFVTDIHGTGQVTI